MNVVQIIARITVFIIVSELTVKALGYTPRSSINQHTSPYYMQDEILGWKPIPGTYNVSWLSEPKEVTILEDSSRSTGYKKSIDIQEAPAIHFIGDSLVFGFGLSDDETTAWKLQSELPDTHVFNWGVEGYGTYQSYLRVMQDIPQELANNSQFYLFFGDYFLERDVITLVNLRSMAPTQPQFNLYAPRTELQSNVLMEFPSAWQYAEFPFRRISSFSALLEEIWTTYHVIDRKNVAEETTLAILDRLNKSLNNNGSTLTLLLYANSTIDRFSSLFNERQINYITCSPDLIHQTEYHLPNDPHPNAKLTSKFAKCLAESFQNTT